MAAEGQPDTHAQAGRRVGKGTDGLYGVYFSKSKVTRGRHNHSCSNGLSSQSYHICQQQPGDPLGGINHLSLWRPRQRCFICYDY